MVGCVRALRAMNSQMRLPQIQAIMMEFERQSEVMDMKRTLVVRDDVMM